jgi:hypothetical protein
MRICGRARLSTDYSETRIKLKFDPDHPAPNIPAWQLHSATDALGSRSVVGEGHQGWVLLDQRSDGHLDGSVISRTPHTNCLLTRSALTSARLTIDPLRCSTDRAGCSLLCHPPASMLRLRASLGGPAGDWSGRCCARQLTHEILRELQVVENARERV